MGSGLLLPQLFLQAVLISVNAVFAAAEFSVMSLNENKLRRQAEGGDKKAGIMLHMVEQPSGFLSSIQIAITLAGFLGSAFAAQNFSEILVSLLADTWGVDVISRATMDSFSVVIITLILSYFTLVLGELVPKRLAMKKPEQVARFLCGIVNGVNKIAKPVVWLLSKSTNGVLRLFNIDPSADAENVTEAEIRMMVDIGEEKGAIEEAEKEMIENVFEFNNMTAADCMTHRTDMTAIWAEETNENIVKIIEETGLSRFPVYQEDLDDIIGILTTRDFLLNMRQTDLKPLKNLLRPVRFVPETVRTDVLFRDMQKSKVHIAIIVDEYGGTSGLITMEDLLEEIVGNIYDEYDPQVQQDIIPIDVNKWRVAGSVDIETFAEALDIQLPDDEEYSTLGGLVLSRLNAIPKEGTQPEVDCFGLHIKVVKVAERRIEWVEVAKIEEYDVIIVGGGPAGCSAAITARMRGLDVLVIYAGDGALEKAKRIDNYPGMPEVSGIELITVFRKQAVSMGALMIRNLVQRILPSDNNFSVLAGSEIYQSHSILLATGTARVPHLENEQDFIGNGVSYCATCDGMLYRGKRVAVVAAYSHAVEEANFLSTICSVTYYIEKNHETSGLSAEVVLSKNKPLGIVRTAEGLHLKTDHGQTAADCVFILRPSIAMSELLPEVDMQNGAIAVDLNLSTSISGIYAAGDVTGSPWQVAKAVGEGNRAVLSVAKHIQKKS